MMISAPLMIVTILVYLSIPELLKLCGKCLVCYLISLTTFYITLSYVYLNAGHNITSPACTILAYIIYLAYLSATIWLNAISYDLWKKFRQDYTIIRFFCSARHFSLKSFGFFLFHTARHFDHAHIRIINNS